MGSEELHFAPSELHYKRRASGQPARQDRPRPDLNRSTSPQPYLSTGTSDVQDSGHRLSEFQDEKSFRRPKLKHTAATEPDCPPAHAANRQPSGRNGTDLFLDAAFEAARGTRKAPVATRIGADGAAEKPLPTRPKGRVAGHSGADTRQSPTRKTCLRVPSAGHRKQPIQENAQETLKPTRQPRGPPERRTGTPPGVPASPRRHHQPKKEMS